MWVQPVVEDLIQERIINKLFRELRPEINLLNALGKSGNTYIRQRMRGFNEAARHLPHFVITDLDSIVCPPVLIQHWVDFTPRAGFLFRIAVREAEAWLLADKIRFAEFIGVSSSLIPDDSEQVNDPKEFIINLARRSRKRSIKDIVPTGTSKVGPGFNLVMEEFIHHHWNVNDAANNSRSLRKAITRINQFLS